MNLLNKRPLVSLLVFVFLCLSEIPAQETAPASSIRSQEDQAAQKPEKAAALEKSLAPLKQEAKKGSAHATQQVYLRYAAAGRHAEAKVWGLRYVEILEAQATKGDVSSALKLAQLYIQGSEFTPPDRSAARHWLRTAADAGNARGAYLLALLVEDDKSNPNAPRQAAELYARAFEAYARDAAANPSDNGESFYWIGYMHLHGQGTRPDAAQAVSWLRKADEAGFPAASAQLARMYAEGTGVPADPAQAFLYRKRMADAWHAPEMLYQVAVQYSRGEGTEADTAQAETYMQKAADAGYPPALLARAAAAMSEGGDGSSRALALYERAASLGNVPALVQVGKMYLNGIGTTPQEEKGLALLRFAADQHGDAEAAFAMARHEEARGNRREADAWYFTASDRGHPGAMARRGLLHLMPGSGYAWNPLRSYHWWCIGKEREDAACAHYLNWLLWAGIPLALLVIFVLPLTLLAKLHRDSLKREAMEEAEAEKAEETPTPTSTDASQFSGQNTPGNRDDQARP